jgi:hypothetical protein
MLLPDCREQLPLLGQEITAATPIGAGRGSKGVEPTRLVSVVPALERCDRVGLGRLGLWWAESLLAELGKSLSELTAIELSTGECADNLASKQRYCLGMILGRQSFRHHIPPFRCAVQRAIGDAFREPST